MHWRQLAESLRADVRYALRGLRREPGYTATAVLTLALGLGAVTAMLAVVDSVFLQPVALPAPQQLVVLGQQMKSGIGYMLPVTDLPGLSGVHAFSVLAGYQGMPGPVNTGDGARIQMHLQLTPDFFRVAGVPAAQGRLLGQADSHAPNAVVSDSFWREAMHSRPDVLGAVVQVGRQPYTVVGVLPRGFRFPEDVSAPVIYTPLLLGADGKNEYGFNSAAMVARLRPGLSIAAASAEAASLWPRIDAKSAKDGPLFLRGYQQYSTQDERGGLFALLGACVLLLGIACVNFANLQIARYTTRAEAMQVRLALGAPRSRLLRQQMTESLLLSVVGAGIGLAAAAACVHAARMSYAQRYTGFERLGVHPLTLAGLFVLVLLVGMTAAVAPAWRGLSARGSVRPQATRSVARSRVNAWLVIVEIGLTCVLIVTAGLMLRTFRAYLDAPLGFDPQQLTVVTLMPRDMQESPTSLKLTEQNVLDQLRATPGIQAVDVQLTEPFSQFSFSYGSDVSFPGTQQKKLESGEVTLTDPGYVGAMHVRPLEGRGFSPADAHGEHVVLVNQAFAREYLQGGSVVGRELGLDAGLYTPASGKQADQKSSKTLSRVVGVVPDEVTGRSIHTPHATIYADWQQVPADSGQARFFFGIAPQFSVRSTLPQAVLEQTLRQVIKTAAPDMAVMQIAAVQPEIEKSLTEQRLELRLAAGFGGVALVLAAVGIYGVLAYAVAQRRREIGIRMALGSSRAGAMRLVARQALWMVTLGLALGFAGAWPAGRAVRAFLFGVKPLDPMTYVAATAVLLSVCAAAAAVPAWRAAQVDPMEALRAE